MFVQELQYGVKCIEYEVTSVNYNLEIILKNHNAGFSADLFTLLAVRRRQGRGSDKLTNTVNVLF